MIAYVDYLWSLCHRPLKLIENTANNAWFLFMLTLSQLCEKVRVDIHWVRAQFHLAKCSWWALKVHGQDIRLKKIDAEAWEDYRARLQKAWETYREGGTIPGMIAALELAGFGDNISIVEHYTTVGQDEWAVFSVTIPNEDMPEGFTVYDADNLIRQLKPAHTIGRLVRECFLCDDANSLTDRDWLCI